MNVENVVVPHPQREVHMANPTPEHANKKSATARMMLNIARDWRLYLMLILPLAFYIIFCYKPMYGIIIAFKNFNIRKGINGSDWTGLQNFEFMLGLRDFPIALRNTLWLNFMQLILGFPVPIVLAIMLNEMRSLPVKKVSQTLLYLPHFLSWVIIGGMVLEIFAPGGVLNSVMIRMGLIDTSIPFLTDGPRWQLTYVLIGVWQSMGWGTILYLSAITGIDMSLFEAAKIDGANKMQQIWHVTLPGIRSTIVVLLILNVGQMMNISFDRPYILGNVKVQDYCDVLSTLVYRVGITTGKFDRATAVGLFQSVVGLIMITSANWISNKLTDGENGIW